MSELLEPVLTGSPWALVAYLLWRNHTLMDRYASLLNKNTEVLTRLLERVR